MKICEVMVVTKIGEHLQHLAGRAWDANHRTPTMKNCPVSIFYYKIICILHSFQITKVSWNATTRILSVSQNFIRNWSRFQKIMSPTAVLGHQYTSAVSACVCQGCIQVESTQMQAADYFLMEVCLNTYPLIHILSYLNHFYSSSVSQLRHYIDFFF